MSLLILATLALAVLTFAAGPFGIALLLPLVVLAAVGVAALMV